MKYTATLSPVQVGQAVKALVLLGEKKITIEETEKDRFVVTTTNETAHSKRLSESYHGKERFSMPKLNFYDTDAVKTFLLNTLIENKEAREEADFERRQTQNWFGQYQEQKARAEAAEANIKAAIAKLAAFNGARQEGVEIGWKDVDRMVVEALLILAPEKTEGGAAK